MRKIPERHRLEVSNLNQSGEALLAALMESNGSKPEKVEPGFMTVCDWAAKINKSESHTCLLLKKSVKAGRVEIKTFRILTGSRVYPVPHYRLA